ncbi:Fur family transcriptional regulator [Marispirochaeta aestuarii]|uniref:Fur family transcriptional regulator n=1 Tax=Marispirochaeta aestuarii TaxID=1963862 RepID=UPI0029C8B1F8|nr:Fur family transcriptional regulator [Marispirochaeta aestuarii]
MPRYRRHGFEEFGPRFRQRGLRMTIPRQVILEALDDFDGFASAEDIFMRVHKDHPGVGLATIYRTLILLTEMGLVSKIDPGDGKFRYELREQKKETKHQHLLICSRCYRVIRYSDFSDEERDTLHSIEARLEKAHDFTIQRHSVHYYGICPSCRERERPDNSPDTGMDKLE